MEIKCKITKSKQDRSRYLRLRRIIGSVDSFADLGSDPLAVIYDDGYDDYSTIFTLSDRHSGKCVGGGRITICKKNSRLILPLEDHNFRLKFILPEFKFDKYPYAEISDYVVLSQYMTIKNLKDIYLFLCKNAGYLGVRYMFMVATKTESKYHMSAWRIAGYKIKYIKNKKIPIHIKNKYTQAIEYIIAIDIGSKTVIQIG